MSYRHQSLVRDSGAPFSAGETFQVARTVTSLPAGRTIASVTLLIKASPTDTDANAIRTKVITSSAQVGIGQITDTGADTAGAFTFEFTEADSANTATATKLGANRTYFYSAVLTLDNGDESVYETGTVKLVRNLSDT